MKHPRIKFFSLFGLAALLAACVTVNIYFPAAKVDKTADEIVSDVYGTEGKDQKTQPKPGDSSRLPGMLALLAPATAHAADATTVSNSAIRALKAQIKGNFAKLRPFMGRNVCVGGQGYLVVGNTSGLPMPQVAKIRRIVSADTAARQRLYREVTAALKLPPDNVGKVEAVFAKHWRGQANPGWLCR